VVRLW
ncbi:bacteriophage lambda tail assembly I family protein, partial [Escherichia coli 3.4870]